MRGAVVAVAGVLFKVAGLAALTALWGAIVVTVILPLYVGHRVRLWLRQPAWEHL